MEQTQKRVPCPDEFQARLEACPSWADKQSHRLLDLPSCGRPQEDSQMDFPKDRPNQPDDKDHSNDADVTSAGLR